MLGAISTTCRSVKGPPYPPLSKRATSETRFLTLHLLLYYIYIPVVPPYHTAYRRDRPAARAYPITTICARPGVSRLQSNASKLTALCSAARAWAAIERCALARVPLVALRNPGPSALPAPCRPQAHSRSHTLPKSPARLAPPGPAPPRASPAMPRCMRVSNRRQSSPCSAAQ